LSLRKIHTARPRSKERVFRYNLSPDHQHVKSKFYDTSKTVEKLRREAQEKREELREKKKLADELRLIQWGCSAK
jgi:excinuclease UvrABC helicase subunit UvrB